MPVEFPFTEVDDIDRAFGGIPNYRSVLEACPDEFQHDNEFSRLAAKWFTGTLDPSTDLQGYELTAETTEDAIAQRRYVETWLGSFEPAHKDKIAVGGWLLSLMLVKPE